MMPMSWSDIFKGCGWGLLLVGVGLLSIWADEIEKGLVFLLIGSLMLFCSLTLAACSCG
jgi:hypothetical protein